VLKVGAPTIISFSNRCFPDKAVAIWHQLDDKGHVQLVERYLKGAGNFTNIRSIDRSPRRLFSDPLYAVIRESAGPHHSASPASALPAVCSTPCAARRCRGAEGRVLPTRHTRAGQHLAWGSVNQPDASSFFEAVSGRNHKVTWAGCIVSLTTATNSAFSASRSVSSRSLAEKASRVFAASYLRR
jgi:hypothetical protein